MLSFIVPAHNEERYLSRTLRAIHGAASALNRPYEVIVVDDSSTDDTPRIAREHNATVIAVDHRQIAATRNAGARIARGDQLFFVDADTTVTSRLLEAAQRCLEQGAAGGGAVARFEGRVPLYAHLLLWWLGWLMRLAGITGGAFMFCSRRAFRATGGFNEGLYGGEDAAMSWALKREGRFVVLWPRVLTSGRRMRGPRGLLMVASLVRMAFFPGMLRRRSSVQKVWYESNRKNDEKVADSLVVRAANALVLLLLLILVTGPLWDFVPRSLIPLSTVPGKIRLAVGVFCCHFGLVAWPCAYFVGRDLLFQKRWRERLKGLLLLAICLFFAWESTRIVAWFWAWISGFEVP
jgi:glycosyltransferase involved in cell wall biosynthesis